MRTYSDIYRILPINLLIASENREKAYIYKTYIDPSAQEDADRPIV